MPLRIQADDQPADKRGKHPKNRCRCKAIGEKLVDKFPDAAHRHAVYAAKQKRNNDDGK